MSDQPANLTPAAALSTTLPVSPPVRTDVLPCPPAPVKRRRSGPSASTPTVGQDSQPATPKVKKSLKLKPRPITPMPGSHGPVLPPPMLSAEASAGIPPLQRSVPLTSAPSSSSSSVSFEPWEVDVLDAFDAMPLPVQKRRPVVHLPRPVPHSLSSVEASPAQQPDQFLLPEVVVPETPPPHPSTVHQRFQGYCLQHARTLIPLPSVLLRQRLLMLLLGHPNMFWMQFNRFPLDFPLLHDLQITSFTTLCQQVGALYMPSGPLHAEWLQEMQAYLSGSATMNSYTNYHLATVYEGSVESLIIFHAVHAYSSRVPTQLDQQYRYGITALFLCPSAPFSFRFPFELVEQYATQPELVAPCPSAELLDEYIATTPIFSAFRLTHPSSPALPLCSVSAYAHSVLFPFYSRRELDPQ